MVIVNWNIVNNYNIRFCCLNKRKLYYIEWEREKERIVNFIDFFVNLVKFECYICISKFLFLYWMIKNILVI